LVQTNFGGALTIAGAPVHRHLQPPGAAAAAPGAKGAPPGAKDAPRGAEDNGSCMIVVATDAPLLARNLRRLARRALAGMARTGASFSNGSGDYVVAFSTAPSLRIRAGARRGGGEELGNGELTPLFRAVAEATEEAIVDSLFAATTVSGQGRTAHAIPVDKVLESMR
jgi:D-aminopeptidase